MKSIIRIVLVLIVFGAAVALAFFSSRPATAVTAPASPVAPQTTNNVVSMSVRAAGTFGSANQSTLAFQLGGRVKELRVKEGAQVKAGDLIAALDTSMLETQVAQAQAALDAAQARLDQLKTPSATDIAAAQAAIASAEAVLAQLKLPSQNDLIMAKADIEKAQAAVNRAQADYDRIGGASNPYISMTPQSLALQAATIDYQKALAAYNARINPSDSQLKQTQATVEQTRAQLARLTSPSVNDIKTAQAAVDQARSALNLAKENIANAQIVAPFDGTVAWIGPHIGESVAPTASAVTVADLSQMQVVIGVDEDMLAQIKLGQSATVTADALPGKVLTGKVGKIGTLATNASSIIRIPVTIDVDTTNAPVAPGMSATVEINIAK